MTITISTATHPNQSIPFGQSLAYKSSSSKAIEPLANALATGMPQFSADHVIHAYGQLPVMTKATLDKNVLPGLQADLLQKHAQNGSIDFLEELADVQFEVDRMEAAQKGLIPEMGAAFWLKIHQQMNGPDRIAFPELIAEVSRMMPARSVAQFEKLSDLPEPEARQFLALLTLRMGYEAGPVYSPHSEKQRYKASALEETQELLEQFPKPTFRESLYLNVLKLQSFLLKTFNLSSGHVTGWAVKGLLHARMKDAPHTISEAALMRLAEFKRMIRSELNYRNMPQSSFDESKSHEELKAQNKLTKATAKPFEALSVEAVLEGYQPKFQLASQMMMPSFQA
jgi:hypothetical protein